MQHLKKLDLDTLKEYALFLVELILIAYPSAPKKDISLFRKLNREVINSAYKSGKLSGFKILIGDLEMEIKQLDSRFIAIANAEIKKKFGFTLSFDNEVKKAEKIVNRGFIKNEAEYRFLQIHFEIINVDQAIKKTYIKKIGKMLDKFNIG